MLAENETAALQFSGGKDSRALLELARPHLDRITVFFGDTGAVYPHVKQYVIDTCKELGAKLVIVEPFMDVLSFTEKHGFPSDLVPVNASPEMGWAEPTPRKTHVQSYFNCCGNMIWLPVEKAIRNRGIKIILRGSKRHDPQVTVPHEFTQNGVEYRSPIWEWTSERVLEYLAAERVKLPDQYPAIVDSMDCWCCTAHMTGQYAGAKLDYAKARYPDLWPEIARRVKAVRAEVTRERRKINAAFARVDA